ncbi:MAG TPA: cupredoxin domain-containing protein [Candidatus Limnocylindrales bacterium]|nr:cupredoxin domain-containing protein [Candidatus Limnocylindrales bacterium]
MRRLSILALPIVAAALVACSSAGAPGWTYAPAPSATPAASGAGSGGPAASGGGSAAPSGGSSAAPSAAASGGGSAAPSGAASPEASTPTGAGASTLTITAPVGAASAGFQPTTLTAKANTSLTIHFDNQDNQAPHNVELKDGSGNAVQLGGDTQFFQGPGTRDYTVPPLAAGTYQYFCVVHPTTMNGTLTIQ